MSSIYKTQQTTFVGSYFPFKNAYKDETLRVLLFFQKLLFIKSFQNIIYLSFTINLMIFSYLEIFRYINIISFHFTINLNTVNTEIFTNVKHYFILFYK